MVKEVMYSCRQSSTTLSYSMVKEVMYSCRQSSTALSYSMVKEVMYTCTKTKFYSALIFYGEGGNVYMYQDKVLQRSHILW